SRAPSPAAISIDTTIRTATCSMSASRYVQSHDKPNMRMQRRGTLPSKILIEPFATRSRSSPPPTTSLAQAEGRAIAQLALGRALRAVSLRCVDPDEPKGLAADPNGVAVDDINLARFKGGSRRRRRDKSQNEGEAGDHV